MIDDDWIIDNFGIAIEAEKTAKKDNAEDKEPQDKKQV